MSKCPIYNTHNACDANRDCLFLRNGGCAVVLGATLAEENKKKLNSLDSDIDDLRRTLNNLVNTVNSLRR